MGVSLVTSWCIEASKCETSFLEEVDRINVVATYLIGKAWHQKLGGRRGFVRERYEGKWRGGGGKKWW